MSIAEAHLSSLVEVHHGRPKDLLALANDWLPDTQSTYAADLSVEPSMLDPTNERRPGRCSDQMRRRDAAMSGGCAGV